MFVGDISFSLQKFHEAVEHYTKALDAEYFDNEFVLELLCGRASAQSKIGNFRDAINDCNRALIICPYDVNMLLLRASCYHYLDDFESSIKDFEAALHTEQVKMNSKQSEEIKLKIKNLKIVLQKEHATKHKCTGDEQIEKNDYAAAIKSYAKAIELWPENISFYEDRAACLMKIKDYKGAIKMFQTALTLDQSCSKICYGMIECNLIIGDFVGAKTAINNFTTSVSANDAIVKLYKRQCDQLTTYINSANDVYSKKDYKMARK